MLHCIGEKVISSLKNTIYRWQKRRMAYYRPLKIRKIQSTELYLQCKSNSKIVQNLEIKIGHVHVAFT